MVRFWEIYMGILLLGCTACSPAAKNNDGNVDPVEDGFPAYFDLGSPSDLEQYPYSEYVTDPSVLDDQDWFDLPKPYRSRFLGGDASLDALAGQVENPYLKDWVRSLKDSSQMLVRYQWGSHMSGPDFQLHFTACTDLQHWKSAEGCHGVHLELIDSLDVPTSLPAPLGDLYQVGRLWAWGFPGSGFFYLPGEIQSAWEEEYLGDYMREFDSLSPGVLPQELYPFYTDSGCWLMYDTTETVFCGGVECGDFWNSGLSLDSVISRVFIQFLDRKWLSIESFAPQPEL